MIPPPRLSTHDLVEMSFVKDFVSIAAKALNKPFRKL